jgi:hypothetical protein
LRIASRTHDVGDRAARRRTPYPPSRIVSRSSRLDGQAKHRVVPQRVAASAESDALDRVESSSTMRSMPYAAAE